MSGRLQSVMMARDPEVLEAAFRFYAPAAQRIVDCTANRRKMWKGVSVSGVQFMDIDPEVNPDIVADFRAMPFANDEIDVLIFDPPHLPSAAASPLSHSGMVRDYGLAWASAGSSIGHFFPPFLAEAARVLKPDGLIFAKLKDFVHNHAYQWTLADFVAAVRAQPGLTACDLIIKRDPCGGNLTSSRWQKAHHARNVHCWWVIIRKGRCEAKATQS